MRARSLAVSLLSYLLFASFGTVAPERYVHADGGIYRGQWQGGKKEGLGVYTYPGGGRYEGRWIDNLKDGIGIYYFPKASSVRLVVKLLSYVPFNVKWRL